VGVLEILRMLTRRACPGESVDTDTVRGSRAPAAGVERSVDGADEDEPRLTDDDERAIETIRRQLHLEFAQRQVGGDTEAPAPRGLEGRDHPRLPRRAWSRARRVGTPVVTLLVGCAALAAILHQKDGDVPATAYRRVPRPENATSGPTTQAGDSSSPLPAVTQTSPSPASIAATQTTQSTDTRSTGTTTKSYQSKPRPPAQRPAQLAPRNRSSSSVAQASWKAKPDAEQPGPPAPPQRSTSQLAVRPPLGGATAPAAAAQAPSKPKPAVEPTTTILAPMERATSVLGP